MSWSPRPTGRRAGRSTPRGLLAAVVLAVLASPAGAAPAEPATHALTIVSGHLYGPGPLGDQETPAGALRGMQMRSGPGDGLEAVIPLLNNGGDEPNIPGEKLQGGVVDGRLCDGTLINENIDVGFVELMNGRFKLLLAAVDGGPSHGEAHFFLDENWNWTIGDDIAIDPGFTWGVVKMNDFRWSTGPRRLPQSTQASQGHPGGIDQAGSRVSGDFIPGRLGDDDLDGRLDGLMNAVGSFPLESVILPGAPFAQTRTFVSDIDLAPADAAALTLANAATYLSLAEQGVTPQDELRSEAVRRIELAARHLERAAAQSGAGEERHVRIESARAAVAHALAVLRGAGVVEAAEIRKLVPGLFERSSLR